MFIPRTLAELEGRPGRGALLQGHHRGRDRRDRSVPGALGQHHARAGVPQVGDIATRDIRAPRDATFVSDSQTQAEQDAQAADSRAATCADRAAGRQPRGPAPRATTLVVRRVVAHPRGARRRGLDPGGRDRAPRRRGARDLGIAAAADRGALTSSAWDGLAAAGRSALETVLADDVREDELVESRQAVRNLVTSELAPAEREIAGDLAASQVEFNLAISPELTEQAAPGRARPGRPGRGRGRERRDRCRRGGTHLRAGPRDAGRARPHLAAGPGRHGDRQPAARRRSLATLLVGFLWRFQPAVWHRNRSVLLFFLALLVSAVAIRVAADRALWAYVVPTTATVLLIAILLEGGAGAAMVVALAVLAGVMNRDALDLSVFVLAGGTTALLTIVRAERLNAFVRTGLPDRGGERRRHPRLQPARATRRGGHPPARDRGRGQRRPLRAAGRRRRSRCSATCSGS